MVIKVIMSCKRPLSTLKNVNLRQIKQKTQKKTRKHAVTNFQNPRGGSLVRRAEKNSKYDKHFYEIVKISIKFGAMFGVPNYITHKLVIKVIMSLCLIKEL